VAIVALGLRKTEALSFTELTIATNEDGSVMQNDEQMDMVLLDYTLKKRGSSSESERPCLYDARKTIDGLNQARAAFKEELCKPDQGSFDKMLNLELQTRFERMNRALMTHTPGGTRKLTLTMMYLRNVYCALLVHKTSRFGNSTLAVQESLGHTSADTTISYIRGRRKLRRERARIGRSGVGAEAPGQVSSDQEVL
jgi:hypothetical protein